MVAHCHHYAALLCACFLCACTAYCCYLPTGPLCVQLCCCNGLKEQFSCYEAGCLGQTRLYCDEFALAVTSGWALFDTCHSEGYCIRHHPHCYLSLSRLLTASWCTIDRHPIASGNTNSARHSSSKDTGCTIPTKLNQSQQTRPLAIHTRWITDSRHAR